MQQNQNEIFVIQKKICKGDTQKIQNGRMQFNYTPMNQKKKFSREDEAEKVDEGQHISLIGCLMYLIAARLDIRHAVGLLSRYMHCASKIHFQVAK